MSLTRNAIQKQAATVAVTKKLRGDTSNDVSETILPNAIQVKTRANCRSQTGPDSRRLIRAKVRSSCSGVREGAPRRGRRSLAIFTERLGKLRVFAQIGFDQSTCVGGGVSGDV